MATIIGKFLLKIGHNATIEMPEGANILTVQSQFEDAYIWAAIDTDRAAEKRTFEVFATGQQILKVSKGFKRNYIGTFQISAGNYVFHVFELYKPIVIKSFKEAIELFNKGNDLSPTTDI